MEREGKKVLILVLGMWDLIFPEVFLHYAMVHLILEEELYPFYPFEYTLLVLLLKGELSYYFDLYLSFKFASCRGKWELCSEGIVGDTKG